MQARLGAYLSEEESTQVQPELISLVEDDSRDASVGKGRHSRSDQEKADRQSREGGAR